MESVTSATDKQDVQSEVTARNMATCTQAKTSRRQPKAATDSVAQTEDRSQGVPL